MLRWFLLTVTVTAVVGCGSGDDGDVPERQTRTAAAATKIRPDGRLDRAPSPLSVADLDKLRPRSAEATVMTLWFYAQWGASPNIVAMYDQRARRALGSGRIASAYSLARPETLAVSPRVVGTRRADRGTLVFVDMYSKEAAPSHESFLLVRRKGEWRVLHDSFLERNVVPVVRSEVQLRVAPRAKETIGEAERAGAEAASRYRKAAIP